MSAPPPIPVLYTPALATARGSAVALTLFRLAGLFTFLAAAMGAVVSATKSGAACPTWPACRPGGIAPDWAMGPVLEFTHRTVAMTAGSLILGSALTGRRLVRPDRWVRLLPWVALAGAAVSAIFGRRVVLVGIPAYQGAIDLLCALTAMTAMGSAAVLAARPARPEPRATRIARIARITTAGVGVLVVMHVTGILTAGRGSYTSSMGWPMWQMVADDRHLWLQVVRLVLAGLAALLVAATAVTAIGTRLRTWGLVVGIVLVAELLLGVVIQTTGLRHTVAAAHSVLAVALLCGMGVLAASAAEQFGHPAQRCDVPAV